MIFRLTEKDTEAVKVAFKHTLAALKTIDHSMVLINGNLDNLVMSMDRIAKALEEANDLTAEQRARNPHRHG